ncbi:MAG: CpaF family protein [Actinomycetota bacterium]|nr:CpaF family protein [Actinomycetota bacterium]
MSDLSRRLTELKNNGSVATKEAPHRRQDDGEATRPELYDVRRRLHAKIAQELGSVLYEQNLDSDRLSALVREHLTRLLRSESTPMSMGEREKLLTDIESDILGQGPIDEYLADPEVTEIMVNGPSNIFVERAGRIYKTPQRFGDETHLRSVIERIVARVGRRIDESSPMVDARLADGSRVNAIIHPLAIGGPYLTIRKFSVEPFTAQDLIGFGTLTPQTAEFLKTCVQGRLNILVAGGTGAGKTSTLNVLSSYIPTDERIVTVEDAAELRLGQPHVLTLESRPPNIEGKGAVGIRELVRNCLRMRPDRIVVGEVRGAEALDMLQAMNTGHDGSISTLHANAPRDVMARLETMVLMAGMDLPVRAIREQIASSIDLVVQQSRLRDGSRRVTHITEVVGMEGDIITMQDLFLFDYGMGIDDTGRYLGNLKATGIRPSFANKLNDQGLKLSLAMFTGDEFATTGRS